MPNSTHLFAAYPAKPVQVGEAIESAVHRLRRKPGVTVTTWRETDIAGKFIADAVVAQIEICTTLVADVTYLNFNVAYEVGYAIGWRRGVRLVKNATLDSDADLAAEVGVFDTLGYDEYSGSDELAELLSGEDTPALSTGIEPIGPSPVYVLLPRAMADVETRLISRLKKAGLAFRTFDPAEEGRLSGRDAIDGVGASHGVVAHLLAKERRDQLAHNLRTAFVAGLAHASGKELVLLQKGDYPVPLDYRDLVNHYATGQRFNDIVADFAGAVAERAFQIAGTPVVEPDTFLARLGLGASAAENEIRELGGYYLETDEFRRCLAGDFQVVIGRKGAGKTALFVQLRNRLRSDRSKVVLDLRPEGYQLIKLRERVLGLMAEGTREHTITAFWEYLLLMEVCHKILADDRKRHLLNHDLFEPYRRLADVFSAADLAHPGDFSERLLTLIARIESRVTESESAAPDLSREKITELLYTHDVTELRSALVDYLAQKSDLWILFDNLDKGWPPDGISDEDILTIRCLLDALSKLQRQLRARHISCHGMIFIRDDVFDLLVSRTPDRGKTASVSVNWTDPVLLRELVLRRITRTGVDGTATFDEIWPRVCVTHVRGEPSFEYLVARCLMRPRWLIQLLQACRSHAVNLGHERIEVADILAGEEAFSTDLVVNTDYEIRDVLPGAEHVLYEFIERPARLSDQELHSVLEGVRGSDHGEMIRLLLWYGFLGLERGRDEITYIFDAQYDLLRLQTLVNNRPAEDRAFLINPAFWKGLEIDANPA